jgi:hypothetical protein
MYETPRGEVKAASTATPAITMLYLPWPGLPTAPVLPQQAQVGLYRPGTAKMDATSPTILDTTML